MRQRLRAGVGVLNAIGWVSAFLDTDDDRAPEAERFWCAVTGSLLSSRRGRREEFATLLPPDGDAFLRAQRVIQSPPGGLHLDLHTHDVNDLAARAEQLGATASYHELGYVVLGSPGGLTFCIVDHPGSRRPEPVLWPGGRSLVDQVCLDIPPSRFEAEVAFWREISGWKQTQHADDSEFARLARGEGMPLQLLLQRLDDEQPVVTAHLDLACDDRDAEVARHVELGASVVRRTDGWTTLRDPSGREYCVTGRSV
ncbi:MAG TPA: VOC family protein [Nocardioidaceae bacterium]|nr:VOC family protein [Nocardioidaceae bacterium]